jgi:NAD(P)H-hydrate epimerase
VIAENAASIVLQNLENVTALLVGPGLGLEETTAGFMRRLFEGQVSKSRRSGLGFLGVQAEITADGVSKSSLPQVVVDADGLRLLARLPDWPKLLPAGSILTPHPGEMAALTGLSVEEIQSNRLSMALKFAADWNQVVILKGALTVIASPDGRAGIIPVATPGLARAGTGDVLAGIVAGLRAQNLPVYESALAGAYLHAQSGLLAVSTLGSSAAVLASDVLDALPGVLKELGE